MPDPSDPTFADPRTLPDAHPEFEGTIETVATTAPVDVARRYLARATLGVGGMGEVRLCTDLAIGRDVAMKVMRRSASGSSGLRARFEREARLQGQLEHPAIVPVYDLGGGYFTMKRVRGHTLERILTGIAENDPAFAAYTLRRLLVAFVQVAQALAFAHARGVVHRDLKPGNIMVGDFGEVYVLDWGLAKVLGRSELAAPVDDEDMPTRVGSRTAHGALLGTPGYMPPEQARGFHDELDARADVYALGAILFEIVALTPLHPRGTTDKTLQSTLRGVDARASMWSKRPNPPTELDAVCVRATALDARERHGTARDLAADVERFLDGERDTNVQRRLLHGHAEAAREAIRRGDRPEALRALSRALAIDPNEREALAAMAELLLSPPGDLPPEAIAELDKSRDEERRRTARGGALAFASWLLVMPLLVVAGVRDLSVFLGFSLTIGLATLAAVWLASRRGRLSDRVGFVALITTTAAIGVSSAYLGPFVLVPAWAASNTLVFAMHARPGWARAAVIAIGTLPVLGPLLLEATGVIEPSFRFVHGRLELSSRIAALVPGPTLVLLIGVTLALIAVPAIIVGRAHDDATRAKKGLATHLWHLRKILPGSA